MMKLPLSLLQILVRAKKLQLMCFCFLHTHFLDMVHLQTHARIAVESAHAYAWAESREQTNDVTPGKYGGE